MLCFFAHKLLLHVSFKILDNFKQFGTANVDLSEIVLLILIFQNDHLKHTHTHYTCEYQMYYLVGKKYILCLSDLFVVFFMFATKLNELSCLFNGQ